MRTVFMMLMDMSVSSCPLILAVILLRMLLRRSPKNISLVLWAISRLPRTRTLHTRTGAGVW